MQPASVSGAVLKFEPAALVIDNHQPDHIDETLTALARLNNSHRLSCPAIFVGERANIALRIRAVESGCRAFLYRPISPMRLVDELDRLTVAPGGDPLRVLVVDDRVHLARRHAGILREAGLETEIVTDPMAIVGPLSSFDPELILMDLHMPKCEGSLLAGVIRQERSYDSIPIVFLSSEQDLEKRLGALRYGGDDFLSKPIEPAHLVQSVTLRARRFRDLRVLIVRDSLSGLLNHTTTMRQINIQLAAARESGSALAVAIVDIDHFKSVNDTHGHGVGDMVIKSLARLLKQRLGRGNIIGRVGGEEFAALLPGCEGDHARALFDDIRAEFAGIDHATDDGVFRTSFSCGIACADCCASVAAVTAAADRALYAAKEQGRNRVVVAAAD